MVYSLSTNPRTLFGRVYKAAIICQPASASVTLHWEPSATISHRTVFAVDEFQQGVIYFLVSSGPSNGLDGSTVGSSVSGSPMPRVKMAVVTEIDVDDGE